MWMAHCDLSGSERISHNSLYWLVIFFLQDEKILPSIAYLISLKSKSHIVAGEFEKAFNFFFVIFRWNYSKERIFFKQLVNFSCILHFAFIFLHFFQAAKLACRTISVISRRTEIRAWRNCCSVFSSFTQTLISVSTWCVRYSAKRYEKGILLTLTNCRKKWKCTWSKWQNRKTWKCSESIRQCAFRIPSICQKIWLKPWEKQLSISFVRVAWKVLSLWRPCKAGKKL